MKTLLESLLDDESTIIDKYSREEAIKQWISDYCVVDGKYTINKDWTIDVDGSIIIKRNSITHFPVKLFTFNKVTNSFICSNCIFLKSLQGCPVYCYRFDISNCISLKNLESSPKTCNIFDCSYCHNLKSLKGAPKKCEIINCSYCERLETLEGVPNNCIELDCRYSTRIKTLKGTPTGCNVISYGINLKN